MPKSYIPPRPIIISAYNVDWPNIYQEEKNKIHNGIADKIMAIEHIGSTSVPNLPAKPIIDIMIGVANLNLADACVAPLKIIGYEYVPQYEVDFPERRYFRRGPDLPNQHFHLHMVVITSEFWKTHLLFRDYLRKYEAARIAYQNLKEELAKKCGSDIMAYCEGKSDFIQNTIQLALVDL